ncbi:MAG: tyrosine-type recombinase/integrase [Pseudomonadota bacterium]
MSRPRDRASAEGLLPRMEAMPRKSGYTYRYHPVGAKPINLGHDKGQALQKVLDLTGRNDDKGTINELWRLYQETPAWKDLSQASRDDYTQCSTPLLKIFGKIAPGAVKPAHCARYLRVERAVAPVRANREMALLSNLMNVGIERGEIDVNPCIQVRRNKERPRKKAPIPEVLAKFLEWAWKQKGQGRVLAGMAEFASLAGNRGVEFREMTWPQVGDVVTRLIRAKQRGGETEQVVEEVEMSGLLLDLMDRIRAGAEETRIGPVFPNSEGNPYTAQAFKLGFARLKKKARLEGALTVETNFTFHDLRAYFVTQFKKKHNKLPELHADPATTARVYDSSRVVNRESL